MATSEEITGGECLKKTVNWLKVRKFCSEINADPVMDPNI